MSKCSSSRGCGRVPRRSRLALSERREGHRSRLRARRPPLERTMRRWMRQWMRRRERRRTPRQMPRRRLPPRRSAPRACEGGRPRRMQPRRMPRRMPRREAPPSSAPPRVRRSLRHARGCGWCVSRAAGAVSAAVAPPHPPSPLPSGVASSSSLCHVWLGGQRGGERATGRAARRASPGRGAGLTSRCATRPFGSCATRWSALAPSSALGCRPSPADSLRADTRRAT